MQLQGFDLNRNFTNNISNEILLANNDESKIQEATKIVKLACEKLNNLPSSADKIAYLNKLKIDVCNNTHNMLNAVHINCEYLYCVPFNIKKFIIDSYAVYDIDTLTIC